MTEAGIYLGLLDDREREREREIKKGLLDDRGRDIYI